MFPRTLLFFVLARLACAGAEPALRPAPPPPPPQAARVAHPLIWDAMRKSHDARPGETVAEFVFTVTNTAEAEMEILRIQPSCGCTVANLPATPWVLAPGAKGSFTAAVDFTGKHGVFSKTLQVESSRGAQMLTVTVNIPEVDEATRRRNQELARKNRQVVFQNDCAACHVAPLVGKKGAELFHVACGICHLASPPAEMVPSLLVAREPRDAAYWLRWISEGKEGTLMPAFAEQHGGPLNREQIESLVAYALNHLPTAPQKSPTPPR
jgi:mono/diheme cytochrome c family protein